MDPDKYMLKSDHAAFKKKREGELLADMKIQLVKGHAEMRRQTAEAVDAGAAGQNAEIICLEGDCRRFSTSLADVLNEVSARRNKYEDWEEWEDAKEESYGEDDYGDHHSGWHRTGMGDRNAAGTGLDYSDRVRRVAASLSGSLSNPAETTEAHDFVVAAKKAALAAALGTTAASHHT